MTDCLSRDMNIPGGNPPDPDKREYPSESVQSHRIPWLVAKYRASRSCGDETDFRSKQGQLQPASRFGVSSSK